MKLGRRNDLDTVTFHGVLALLAIAADALVLWAVTVHGDEFD